MDIERRTRKSTLLDLKRVHYNNFTLKEYQKFKKKRGSIELRHGSFILNNVVTELKVQSESHFQQKISDIPKEDLTYNYVYQKYYGGAITQHFIQETPVSSTNPTKINPKNPLIIFPLSPKISNPYRKNSASSNECEHPQNTQTSSKPEPGSSTG